MKEKICIIGAGPAGIIAAGTAGSRGKEVYLFEQNERIGKKLFITGKGRCNITNNSPIEDFFDKVMRNKNFLYSSFYTFTNDDIMHLLESYGLKTKVERGNRVFPTSDKSSDVIKALSKYLEDNDVKVMLNSKIEFIDKINDKFKVRVENQDMYFDKLLISTGGKSYPSTGSTGDGYKFAKMLGHSVTEIKPSLIPIEVNESWVTELMGLSLKNITLSAYVKDKKIYDEMGEMVFTHYGISGPIVLSMSNYLHKHTGKKIRLSIDLKPALDIKKLDDRILRDFENNNNRFIRNALDDLLPQKLISTVIYLAEIDPEKPVNQITKEERGRLLKTIKELTFTFKAFRPIEEAIVTSGGVSIKEVNPSTMESKLVPGLFFAGEVMDVHGLTGGYNLQIAYSTGYLAGINI